MISFEARQSRLADVVNLSIENLFLLKLFGQTWNFQ